MKNDLKNVCIGLLIGLLICSYQVNAQKERIISIINNDKITSNVAIPKNLKLINAKDMK